ncbi:hypothetical protein M5W68_00030 [Paenibacillus larvae]|uniref:hypothetical protein n=1 Tax=Paenibacillus larvae TaxID=1464 RepID=UPI0022819163|nr:hypothetical protein [Paenibacillus larvae]MCY9511978.1 hypothetical protein [Paenibacillus larvae]MCY9523595.1 hypothetical protein [Paenibacillus larvae]
MEAIGKLFADNQADTQKQLQNKTYQVDNAIVIFYDYTKSNSYISILNKANDLGLKQIIITPYKFSNVIKFLSESKFKVKTMEFDPPLETEKQNNFNKVLSENLTKKSYDEITKEIYYYNDEYNSIPRKMSFLSDKGNRYSLFNNGIIYFEEEKGIQDLNSFLLYLSGGST